MLKIKVVEIGIYAVDYRMWMFCISRPGLLWREIEFDLEPRFSGSTVLLNDFPVLFDFPVVAEDRRMHSRPLTSLGRFCL